MNRETFNSFVNMCGGIILLTGADGVYPSAGRSCVLVFLHDIDEQPECIRFEIHISIQC